MSENLPKGCYYGNNWRKLGLVSAKRTCGQRKCVLNGYVCKSATASTRETKNVASVHGYGGFRCRGRLAENDCVSSRRPTSELQLNCCQSEEIML